MKVYKIIINNIEPLILKSNISSVNNDTLQYIPGSTMRGAIANLYVKLNDSIDIFKKNKILFSNFYPVTRKDICSVNYSYPFLFTHFTCKRYPGIPGKGEAEAHGIYNLLKSMLMRETKNCSFSDCGETLVPASGFYNILEKSSFVSVDVQTRVFSHTGINNQTGTIRQSVLYDNEAIIEDNYFIGYIRTDVDLQQIISNSMVFKIGKSRTRGYGKIKVHKIEQVEPDKENFIKRFNKFNEILNYKDYYLFSLNLISDTIIFDNYLRFSKIIDSQYIENILNLKDIELIYKNFNNVEVIGWNDYQGVPKRKFLAIEKGSVFLFKISKDAVEKSVLIDKLFKLEQNGIGFNREEGHGDIMINNVDFFYEQEA